MTLLKFNYSIGPEYPDGRYAVQEFMRDRAHFGDFFYYHLTPTYYIFTDIDDWDNPLNEGCRLQEATGIYYYCGTTMKTCLGDVDFIREECE